MNRIEKQDRVRKDPERFLGMFMYANNGKDTKDGIHHAVTTSSPFDFRNRQIENYS